MSITSLTAFFKRRPGPVSHNIEVAGRLLPVTIIRSARARRAALRVDAARGEIRLTLPPRVGEAKGRQLIHAHLDWIAGKVARFPLPRPIAPGGSIPLDGEELTIDWQAGRPRTPHIDAKAKRLIVGGPADGVDSRVERWLRRHALDVLTTETRHCAEQAGLVVDAIRVGDPKGRWGSCSSRSRIAYSWRLVMAPSWVRQSVVTHEVAHLVHLNHSPDFHALHRQLLGRDPAPARAWLAANGPALYWVGRPR